AGQIVEWTSRSAEFLKRMMERTQRGKIEAGSYFRGEDQLANHIITYDQCAKEGPRACWSGITADDKFLFLLRFDLEPRAASAAGLVEGILLFGDDSFQASALDFFPHPRRGCVQSRRQPQRAGGPLQQTFQP